MDCHRTHGRLSEAAQACGVARSHFAIYSLARFHPCPAKLVSTLQIQPEFGRSTEESRQPGRGVSRHRALFVENCGDSIDWDTQGLRHGARRKSHLLQLTAQDLAEVNRSQNVRHCRFSLLLPTNPIIDTIVPVHLLPSKPSSFLA